MSSYVGSSDLKASIWGIAQMSALQLLSQNSLMDRFYSFYHYAKAESNLRAYFSI